MPNHSWPDGRGFVAAGLAAFIETEAINAFERAAGTLPGAREVAVAFADLVGFTRLGRNASGRSGIGRPTAGTLGKVVTSPVQFVKTIGDAVMLVCSDPLSYWAVLDRVDAAAADDFPRLRVGLRLVRRQPRW